ncbi:MAG TPA: hypothetical protein VJQ54_05250, partial [Candidatus Sulfotelmatobacter sp.]|nr:hypothetical protein [Candidatus Sulfotelmatobacter sp.]
SPASRVAPDIGLEGNIFMSKEKTKAATALLAYFRSATKLVTSLRAPRIGAVELQKSAASAGR